MKEINLITLGCSKNRVDSEHLAPCLKEAGYSVIFDSDRIDVDTIVINTCGFIGDAKKESIDCILRAAQAKTQGFIKHLFVIGCLSERYAEELKTEIPEVDAYFGARSLEGIVKALGAAGTASTDRVLSTPSHYAYLKISEGCDWRCGYCAIPLIRGRHVSVPMEDIVQEAEKLSAMGVRELMVVAQDSTYYGLDLYGKRMLPELLRRLCRVDGIEWIRLHYAYPTDFPMEVADVIAEERKMCKYLDIPLQHISDNMLSAMHRRHTKQQAVDLIRELRRRVKGIAIRTTMLVGYPGETEDDIKELEEFIREARFERLGVFAYSEEEGTFSAKNLKDSIPEEEKQRRVDRIMAAQREVSEAANLKSVGKTIKVIIDRREGDWYIGRTEKDSVEVDGEVLLPASEHQLRRGRFYSVKVTGAEDYDLYATVVPPIKTTKKQ